MRINKMDDNRLAKIAKNGKADTFKPSAFETLVRKLMITGEQTG